MKTKSVFLFSVALLMVLATAACKEESVLPDFPREQPAPPSNRPPTVPTPPTGSDIRLKKITWSALDFKTFFYDEQGKLLRYYFQYNNVQGSNSVHREQYDYSYRADGKLIELKTRAGIRFVYTYQNGVWKEATAYDITLKARKHYQFEFNDRQRLVAYRSFTLTADGQQIPESRVFLSYDAVGNLTHWKEEWYQENGQTFTKGNEIVFSDFDEQKYVPYGETFGDVLHPLHFWVNNPGKKVFVGTDDTQYYQYTYNAAGYPLSKSTRSSRSTVELRATYEY